MPEVKTTMSARLLKKVLKEQEQQKQQVIEEEEDELLNCDESESPDSSARSSKNPFDLLNEGDEDEDNADQVWFLNPIIFIVSFFLRLIVHRFQLGFALN